MTEAALVEIDYTFALPVSVHEAFALVSDPRQELVWREVCVDVRLIDDEPRTGSQYEIMFEMLGKRMEFTVDIEEYTPGHGSRFRTSSGSFHYFGGYDYTELANGITNVRWTFNVDPGDYFGVMPTNLLSKLLIESIKQDSAKLAARLGTK